MKDSILLLSGIFALLVCVASKPQTVLDDALRSEVRSVLATLNTRERTEYARLIGGDEYEQGKWPWLVSLQAEVPDKTLFGIALTYKRVYCGASLLSDKWVLTAAHCFDASAKPEHWHARLGDVDLDSAFREKVKGWVGDLFNKDSWKDWYIRADKIIVHPEYDPKNLWENDIALVRLSEDVPSGSELLPHIQTVTLPRSDDNSFPEDGHQCVMKGWGCTENGGYVSDTAMEVSLPKVSDRECSAYWGMSVTSRLCAGYNLEGKGICPGDSGGPLTCVNADSTWVQVGIASFTSGNKPGAVPGVFTRVSYYVPWINNIIHK